MHEALQKLNLINNKVKEIVNGKQLKTNPQVIAISKTFTLNEILPLIEGGHVHFGENKIQEAETKWINLKDKYKNLQLHMVGKLQSNKAKKAVKLFDYIHSLDNAKLASKICQYQKELNKKIKLFIQVNVAEEKQKSGILLSDLNNFYDYCKNELFLNIIGLMCIPPIDSDSDKYFKLLKDVSEKFKLKDLSMGMTDDYEKAILYKSTYLRIGTAIFGKRKIS
tara:strand:- start:2187 stop:2855 length:669 start_codon:yes stop_codon:yes gene_type:complete